MKVPAWSFVLVTILLLISCAYAGMWPLFTAVLFMFIGLGLAELFWIVKTKKTVSQHTWASGKTNPVITFFVLTELVFVFYLLFTHLVVLPR